jgi:hypothetical protein
MADAQKDNLQEFLDELESESQAPVPAKKPDLKVVEGGAGVAPGAESNEDSDLENTLGSVKEETPPDSLLDQELEKEIDEAMDTLKPASDGTLTLNLSGNMTLKLSYAQNGQNVSIRFERECLYVNLDNGTEFKIPVKS